MVTISEGQLLAWIERTNAAWLALDFCLVLYLGYYLWTNRDSVGVNLLSWWNHPKVPLYVQAAAAIMVFHVGDLGARFFEVLVHRQARASYEVLLAAILFSLIAAWGMLCMLRVFSGPWMGKWVWLGGCTLALLAASFVHWFV